MAHKAQTQEVTARDVAAALVNVFASDLIEALDSGGDYAAEMAQLRGALDKIEREGI